MSDKNLANASRHGGRRSKPASSSDFFDRREFAGLAAGEGYSEEGMGVIFAPEPDNSMTAAANSAQEQ